mgnify:FL=1
MPDHTSKEAIRKLRQITHKTEPFIYELMSLLMITHLFVTHARAIEAKNCEQDEHSASY